MINGRSGARSKETFERKEIGTGFRWLGIWVVINYLYILHHVRDQVTSKY